MFEIGSKEKNSIFVTIRLRLAYFLYYISTYSGVFNKNLAQSIDVSSQNLFHL